MALSGNFVSLLSLFNRELSHSFVSEGVDTDDRRLFWRNAALRFHSSYLAQGRTHVVNVLEKEGNFLLGFTFQLLLNLIMFFDHCRSHDWQSAWQLIDQLHLFPKKDSEISNKVEAFHSFGFEIKQIFHIIALNAMDSLYQQHSFLKANVSMNSGSTEQRLMELRMNMKLLVTFSSLIQLSFNSDTQLRITRMEACMI